MRILYTILASLFFHCSFAQQSSPEEYISIFHVGFSNKYFNPIVIYPQSSQLDTSFFIYKYRVSNVNYQRIKQYVYQYYIDNKDTTINLTNQTSVGAHFYSVNRKLLDTNSIDGYAIANYYDTSINFVCILYSQEENATFFDSFIEFLSTIENTQPIIGDINSRILDRLNSKHSKTIHDLYNDSFKVGYMLDNPAKNIRYSTSKVVDGYIIEYRYYWTNDTSSCSTNYFFCPLNGVKHSTTLFNLFQLNILFDFDDNYGAGDFVIDVQEKVSDSLRMVYQNEYYQIKNDLNSEQNNNLFFQVNQNECVRFFKVKAQVDIYFGDKLSLKAYVPLFQNYNSDSILLYQCRSIVNAIPIKSKELLEKKYTPIALPKNCLYKDSY
ncbi:MAG: hypothetical protein H6551_11565 [Chitinophagales bacterium]|nr:hypothetical protein [Chitinophagaceae bacterium]MCB9065765.1 hypothetical protein [Chitinophagales bacterium]